MTEQPSSLHTPQWDVADRMRKALREAGVGVQEMSEYLGVSRNGVGNWISGRRPPSIQTLRLWALRCGVRYEWLATGEPAQNISAPATGLEPVTCRSLGNFKYSLRWPIKEVTVRNAA